MIPVLKSHPLIFPGAASAAQAHAGNYRKRKVKWQGLTISIENEAGAMRRGRNRATGEEWEVRMVFPYGYFNRTEGVDGDHVDVFLGPNLNAPNVYIVHQRKYGDWEQYDEDKCMVGFDSEHEARQAFLANYNDPRFLGPITTMPVAEFVTKAKATKEAPAMIKSQPVMLFLKAHVDSYTRNGKIVQGYDSKVQAGSHDDDYPGHNRKTARGMHMSTANRHERQAEHHSRLAAEYKHPKFAKGHADAAADHRIAAQKHREAAEKYRDDEKDGMSPDPRSSEAHAASGHAMTRDVPGYKGPAFPAAHVKDTGVDPF